ncbi:hypothetical protein RF55_15045, partial [Lasius niger]
MDNEKYIVVEFEDGLQLIPATWFNADTNESIWPSNFKTKLRINKAIIMREMPKDKSDWELLSIKKVYGIANTYEEGMQKLILAEETSNIDTNSSSNELKEKEKKRRRLKARKYLSSSSEEDLHSHKENTITREKILPAFPQKRNFMSSDKEMEFKKIMLGKLNRILFKLDNIENKLEMLEEKVIQFRNQSCIQENNNIQFPICTLAVLTVFEEQLQDTRFKEDVLNIFQLVGGNSAHSMIRNIFKKAITDDLATTFSWTGKRTKQSFKDLKLSKVII